MEITLPRQVWIDVVKELGYPIAVIQIPNPQKEVRVISCYVHLETVVITLNGFHAFWNRSGEWKGVQYFGKSQNSPLPMPLRLLAYRESDKPWVVIDPAITPSLPTVDARYED